MAQRLSPAQSQLSPELVVITEDGGLKKGTPNSPALEEVQVEPVVEEYDLLEQVPRYDERNCKDIAPDLFQIVDRANTKAYNKKLAKAMAVCDSCVIIEECREIAIINDWPDIWGGTTETERKKIKKERALAKKLN